MQSFVRMHSGNLNFKNSGVSIQLSSPAIQLSNASIDTVLGNVGSVSRMKQKCSRSRFKDSPRGSGI